VKDGQSYHVAPIPSIISHRSSMPIGSPVAAVRKIDNMSIDGRQQYNNIASQGYFSKAR